MTVKLVRSISGCALLAAFLSAPCQAATSRVAPPLGALTGLHESGAADPRSILRIAIELQPHGDLDALAQHAIDPADPARTAPLTADQVRDRFGRLPEARALAALLRTAGARNAGAPGDGLIAGGNLTVSEAEAFFHARWLRYTDGARTVLAPSGPLSVPAANVRDVRGAVSATTPKLDDTRPTFTLFRGDWYDAARFRSMMNAVEGGGTDQRIVVIEDASDRFSLDDVATFLRAQGPPPGAQAQRETERSFAFKAAGSDCGRDDRGQEPALDVDGSITMAPLASVVVDYDDVCSPGNDGTFAMANALDLDPTVLVFPFSVGPVDTTAAARYGQTPLPILEAAVRGIPLVVPAGDDGAYGYREPGVERARVVWPCVLSLVICVGGTQLGDRDGVTDEGPWNDLVHATGGGISGEPRPVWQNAPGDFLFSPQYVHNRIVPDVSADASGHLRVYWHSYGLGGVGGTSESASIVGAQLAAINSLVPVAHRLRSVQDLYALARRTPAAFRDVQRENDRGYKDNTLRPPRPPLPKNYRGVLPTPPPLVYGCAGIQPQGCSVTTGFDAVSGIGSIMERAAVDALR